jgi:hypothetical protein
LVEASDLTHENMKIREPALFCPALFLLIFSVLPTSMIAADRFQFTTRSDHPIDEVCTALEAQFHWRISYEDAPVFDRDDLKNGTAPNGVPWLVLRDVPAAVDVPIETNMPASARGKTLQSILDSHRLSGRRAGFTVTQNGDIIYVMATSVKGADGKIQPFEPLLDTRISLVRGRYDLWTLVTTILSQVSQIRGIPITIGTVSTNLFTMGVTEEANNEAARDILVRAFEEINGTRYAQHVDPVRLVWYMNYDPNGRMYFFNVHNVGPEVQSVNTQPAPAPMPQGKGRPNGPMPLPQQ